MYQGGGIVCITIVCALVANYGYADNTNKSGALAAIVFMYFFVTCYGFGVDATSYVSCSLPMYSVTRLRRPQSMSLVWLIPPWPCFEITSLPRNLPTRSLEDRSSPF